MYITVAAKLINENFGRMGYLPKSGDHSLVVPLAYSSVQVNSESTVFRTTGVKPAKDCQLGSIDQKCKALFGDDKKYHRVQSPVFLNDNTAFL